MADDSAFSDAIKKLPRAEVKASPVPSAEAGVVASKPEPKARPVTPDYHKFMGHGLSESFNHFHEDD